MRAPSMANAASMKSGSSDRVRKPWAMVVPNGPSAARCGSVWIHWWSPVASANRFTCAWVTSIQSVTATSCPMQAATSE
jgi:hypothetical protein